MITIDKIIRSKRKTVAIILEPDGKVTVRAPLRLSRAQIDLLVEGKADWLQKRQEQIRQAQRMYAPRQYRSGEFFHFLGAPYPLEIVDGEPPLLSFDGAHFRLARRAQARAAEVFEAWYRDQARQYIGRRVDELSQKFGYSVRSLRITGAKTRWGSCGSNSSLNFTWRLIMAPEAAVDYVIVHELVHLEVRNHAGKFWEKVQQLCPDYAEQRKWLKANAWLLK
jgi:predicted metal-dependent hydrolase